MNTSNNMKYFLAIILGFLAATPACAQQTTEGDTIISVNPAILKVKVLYFHITNRCNTCRLIEANVRKTISDHFRDELSNGMLALYILNCELEANKEWVEKYEAYGATLALTAMNGNRELNTEDITGWAFQKAQNTELFIRELKDKINKMMIQP